MSLCCALQYQAPRLILDIHDVLGPSLKSSTMGTLSVLSTTTEAMVADRSRYQGRKERGTGKGAGFHGYGSICHCKKKLEVRDSRRKGQLLLQSGRFPSLVSWPHGFVAFRESMRRENDLCHGCQKTKGKRKRLES